MSRGDLDMGGTAFNAWRRRSAWAAANEGLLPKPRFDAPALPDGPAGVDLPALDGREDAGALLQLARELARLAPPGEARDQLLLLGLAMLLLGQEGTTSLPLGEGLPVLEALLTQLDPAGRARAPVLAFLRDGRVPAALSGFIGARGTEPLLLTAGSLSLHRFARLEQRLAEALAVQLAQPPLSSVSEATARPAFEAVARLAPIRWTVDQQWALLNALHLPFSVISGGPGTGKTTIVVSLLRILVRLGVSPARIALAAPTGKAANRMYEEVRRQLRDERAEEDRALRERLPEPRTLHRLLGYSPGRDRFGTGEVNPLDADVVLVDESSMVDLFLMERLFRACAPAPGRARRVILLGDANQLPSVEAGMVLHHLAQFTQPLRWSWLEWTLPGGKPSTSTPTPASSDPRARYLTTLTYSHRMDPERPAGKAIYEYAEAIRKGEAERFEEGGALALPRRTSADELELARVEHLDFAWGHEQPTAFFERWWARRWLRPVRVGDVDVPLAELREQVWRFEGGRVVEPDAAGLRALLEAAESQRVLCLTRGRAPDGATRTNAWFSARRRGGAAGRAGGARFAAGEPVIFTRNDYGLRLFNGYSGVVAKTQLDGQAPRLRVIFDQPLGLEAFELDLLGDSLELAYALTVHKAQGSQVECAALLLPKDDRSPLLVRQLVYTAVSRASHAVALVGPIARLVKAVRQPVRRFSRVMERVQALSTGEGRGPG